MTTTTTCSDHLYDNDGVLRHDEDDDDDDDSDDKSCNDLYNRND